MTKAFSPEKAFVMKCPKTHQKYCISGEATQISLPLSLKKIFLKSFFARARFIDPRARYPLVQSEHQWLSDSALSH